MVCETSFLYSFQPKISLQYEEKGKRREQKKISGLDSHSFEIDKEINFRAATTVIQSEPFPVEGQILGSNPSLIRGGTTSYSFWNHHWSFRRSNVDLFGGCFSISSMFHSFEESASLFQMGISSGAAEAAAIKFQASFLSSSLAKQY
nr:hypothetical protein CFP56_39762 [Quercus suber]